MAQPRPIFIHYAADRGRVSVMNELILILYEICKKNFKTLLSRLASSAPMSKHFFSQAQLRGICLHANLNSGLNMFLIAAVSIISGMRLMYWSDWCRGRKNLFHSIGVFAA